MAEQAANVENYDESLLKCEKINKIIPTVCDNIKQIQLVDKNFGFDFNLKLAEQLLGSLNTMKHPSHNGEKDKKAYVEEYREHLTSGLRSLGDFFDNLIELEGFSDDQRGKISSISANIVISQDSIIRIAGS